uniref:protein CURVATURE THYLAKOID 1D, chloroplastic n=1 Tax=Erigeron canadensis TaxID=72917 RepID=UPI001CB8CDDB|nr:protein CURVATURE THYLAKOID 1D, chloroplastic [Erigeron canadensis]
MELCTSTNNLKSLTFYTKINPQMNFTLPLKPNTVNPGLRSFKYTAIKATSSEETSSGANQYVKEEPEVVRYSSVESTVPVETSNQYDKEESEVVNYSSVESVVPEETSNGDKWNAKEESDGVVTDEETQTEGNSRLGGFSLFKDDAVTDDQSLQFDFLDKLKVELDLQDSFSIALLSVGGVAALWLTASIVGAIDRIPLFPKLLEVVGLGYTIWFSTRYLLFKRNRDELVSKVEEIKQQVLGPKN